MEKHRLFTTRARRRGLKIKSSLYYYGARACPTCIDGFTGFAIGFGDRPIYIEFFCKIVRNPLTSEGGCVIIGANHKMQAQKNPT